jgi:hypothetical protein
MEHLLALLMPAGLPLAWRMVAGPKTRRTAERRAGALPLP